MKAIRRQGDSMGARQVAVLLGVFVGLGIVVHQSFFLVAGAVAAGALAVATAHVLEEQRGRAGPVQHPR